jgi:hypothetical protein
MWQRKILRLFQSKGKSPTGSQSWLGSISSAGMSSERVLSVTSGLSIRRIEMNFARRPWDGMRVSLGQARRLFNGWSWIGRFSPLEFCATIEHLCGGITGRHPLTASSRMNFIIRRRGYRHIFPSLALKLCGWRTLDHLVHLAASSIPPEPFGNTFPINSSNSSFVQPSTLPCSISTSNGFSPSFHSPPR